MAFVDSLRGDPREKERQIDQENAARMAEHMLWSIRYYCEDNRTRHKAEAYLMERTSEDIIVNYTRVVDYPYTPQRTGAAERNPSKWQLAEYRRNPKRSALVDRPLCRENYRMHALTEEEGVQYAADELRKLLIKDGFSAVSVKVVSLPDIYDEVREVGFFNTDIYFDRKKSSNIVGYTIKFHVEW